MTSSRRSILKAGAAAAALTGIGAPHVARAQQRPPRQARMVPHGNLNVLDERRDYPLAKKFRDRTPASERVKAARGISEFTSFGR